MEKIPLWKRVGGWLRRSQSQVAQGPVEHVDPEGMVIEAESSDPQHPQSQALASYINNNQPEVLALEQGFSRLVEVLESINENVVAQRTQGAELKIQLDGLGQFLKSLPMQGQDHEAIKELTQEIRENSIRNQQIIETVGSLPELTQAQVHKLSEITHQLELSGQADEQIAENFRNFDQTVQGVLENSKAQSASLINMGGIMERKELQLQELLTRQNRRLFWMFGIFAFLILLLAGAALVIGILRNTQ